MKLKIRDETDEQPEQETTVWLEMDPDGDVVMWGSSPAVPDGRSVRLQALRASGARTYRYSGVPPGLGFPLDDEGRLKFADE